MDVPEGVRVREEEPIARHLPLRASPGAFERWAEARDETTLAALIRAARAEKLQVRCVHPFGDALPPEGGVGGLALRLGGDFEAVRVCDDGTVEAGAAALLALIAMKPGFSAWSRAGGTVGDALADGWILPAVIGVRRFRGRGFEDVDGAPDEPRALVVRVRLRPGTSHGGVPAGTAWSETGRRAIGLRAALGKAGVGAVRLHDAALAEDDAAVLVNRGEAKPRELRLLMSAVADKVKIGTGLELVERLVSPGRGGRL
jgi:hypothetical protein